MPTVTVIRVFKNYPEDFNGSHSLLTADCEIDSGKFVRMGYPQDEITSAAVLRTRLEADAEVLTDPAKQRDADFGDPAYGTRDDNLKPAPFDI